MEMFSSEIAPYEPFLLFKVKENTFLKKFFYYELSIECFNLYFSRKLCRLL
jgi:hypothetical protein